MLGLLVSIADRVVLVGVLVRFWGHEAFASWSAILAAAALLSMAELSLNLHFGNRWRALHLAGDEAGFQRLLGVSLSVYSALLSLLALGVVVLVLTIDLRSELHVKAFDARTTALIFVVLALAQLSQVSAASVSQVFRGRGEFVVGQLADAGVNFLVTAVALTTALAGVGPVLLAFIYVGVQGPARWIVMATLIKARYPTLRLQFARPTKADIRSLAGSVQWLAVIQAATVLNVQAPVMLLAGFNTASLAIVSFVTARTMVSLSRTFAQFAANGVGIEIAGAVAGSGWTAAWPAIRTAGLYLHVVVGVLSGGLIAFAVPAIDLWTGHPELYDPVLLGILLSPALMISASLVVQVSLLFANELRLFAISSSLQAILGLGLASALTPVFGITGFAAGLALAEVLTIGVLTPILVRRFLPLALRWRASGMLRGLVATSIGWLGGWAILSAVGARGLGVLASGAVWLTLVAAPVLFIFLPRGMRHSGWLRICRLAAR